ncbi:nitroreductase family protein [Clostridium manihotivorum]|uniref:Nitroreductase family protein n=1 Tax=Clostridium manihotivorum TaxID=2320868 RepID=A0A410DXR4_9CLOT|nr:nitroreductase family protein [Clostridium manihotivorum]QAA33790.1 nitroreductase family protein [Clostridium manihotivorum]
MEEIFKRRSIRKYEDKPVEKEKIERLLRAAMQAPSAVNQQPWEFIVVEDKDTLKKLSEMSPYAKMVASAPVAFVLVANTDKLKVATACHQDMGACAENLLLEATHLGLGAVWLGVSTAEPVSAYVKELFNLPDNIVPFNVIPVGYPDQKSEFVDRYDEAKVHYGKW